MVIIDMRINETSQSGLFPFKLGITYEKDDLIFYEGIIYRVTTGTYIGTLSNLPPDTPECVSTLEELSESDQVVTTKNLDQLLRDTVQGISLGGYISRISIDDQSELDDYKSTGVFQFRCKIDIEGLAVDAFEGLLRVYRFNTGSGVHVVQEIIDFGELESAWHISNIYYRIFMEETGIWSPFNMIVNAGSDPTEFNQSMQEFVTRERALHDRLISNMNKMERATMLNVVPITNGSVKEYYVTGLTPRTILDIQYLNSSNQQCNVTISINNADLTQSFEDFNAFSSEGVAVRVRLENLAAGYRVSVIKGSTSRQTIIGVVKSYKY